MWVPSDSRSMPASGAGGGDILGTTDSSAGRSPSKDYLRGFASIGQLGLVAERSNMRIRGNNICSCVWWGLKLSIYKI